MITYSNVNFTVQQADIVQPITNNKNNVDLQEQVHEHMLHRTWS
jgi:hypothetical protein